jgi:hypothetical protein
MYEWPSAVGLILVVMGILAVDNNLWLTLALIAAGALVLVWFLAWVRGKERAGKEPHLDTGALLRAHDDRLGSGRPHKTGGRSIPARGPCRAGRRAATAAEPAPASRDDVSLISAGRITAMIGSDDLRKMRGLYP